MSEQSLGLKEGVSIALGGMIGGGIFAVLGVVAQLTRAATWFAFILAGIVALAAGYSYNVLNKMDDNNGGSVTFIQSFLGNSTLAGMVGWTLLFGYIGSMAMYAFAFGSFTVGLLPKGIASGGLPLRPVISILAVAFFVGLNLLGAQATGSSENLMVGAKVAILLAFGIGGLAYGFSQGKLAYGVDRLVSFSPIMAAGVSFVAFQGWQLLFYDQESFSDPVETVRKAVYISIVAAIALYIIVAITTVSLAPMDVIKQHPERALAVAADPFIPAGFLIISLAALFSTGSAINATLFSSGHFTKGMLTDDLVPDQVGDADSDGIPERSVILIGVIVAAFTALGSLDAITSFASLTFIVVFGAMSYLAFSQRDRDAVSPYPPAVGVIGSIGFFFLMGYHLYSSKPGTFGAVLAIAVGVILVEALYFERDYLEEEITEFESSVADSVPGLGD